MSLRQKYFHNNCHHLSDMLNVNKRNFNCALINSYQPKFGEVNASILCIIFNHKNCILKYYHVVYL
jgi:hypothetical protein